MSLHKEINLETEICQHLAANGWLYAEGDAAMLDVHTSSVQCLSSASRVNSGVEREQQY
jgi:hypothetical protein